MAYDFAGTLNGWASWINTTGAAVENVKAAVSKPAPVATPPAPVTVTSDRVTFAGYSFDWRIMAAAVGLLVVAVVLKMTLKKG